MSGLNGFDRIAPFYDSLQRMVFGRALVESQRAFLDAIPDDSNVLILGGGSGELMKRLLELKGGCHLWYVEASAKMLAMARERMEGHHVHFIHGTEASIPADVLFDAAITGFFLDVFPDDKVALVARTMDRHLRRSAVWLITDFLATGKWWQRVLLWTMYKFFIITSGIEARRLPNWEKLVAENGFAQMRSKSFFHGFIKSSVWTKCPF